MAPMFSIFTLAIKFDSLFLAIFQSFYSFVSCIFDKLASPPLNICLKNVLNHYLAHSSAYNSLRSDKNVFFFLFCILVDMPMRGGAAAPPPHPPWVRYWLLACIGI